jgi:glutaminase
MAKDNPKNLEERITTIGKLLTSHFDHECAIAIWNLYTACDATNKLNELYKPLLGLAEQAIDKKLQEASDEALHWLQQTAELTQKFGTYEKEYKALVEKYEKVFGIQHE